MKRKSEENKLKEETLSKVKSLLSKDIKQELEEDKNIKFQMQLIFSNKKCLEKLTYPDIEQPQILLLRKLIELFDLLFNISAIKREEYYYENLINIKNKDIKLLINELRKLESFDFEINKNLIALFNIISNSLDMKKSFTLSEYIDSIFMKLAFSPKLLVLLKFQIYTYISRYNLSNFGIVLKFRENEINLTEDASINLIMDLFNKENVGDELLVQSIIILNYDSLNDTLAKYDFEQIIKGIKAVSEKSNIFKNCSLCVERVMLMFIDEMEMPQRLRKKRKPRKKVRKKNQNVKNPKKEDIKEEQNDPIQKVKTENMNKDKSKDIVKAKENNNEINLVELSNEKNNVIGNVCEKNKVNEYNLKNNINNLLNQIINKINMGNDVKNELAEIKANISCLVDENEGFKKSITSLINENQQLKEKIEKLSNNIDDCKEDLENLENDCEEMKEMLGDIQLRYLSKNFLNCFKSYITESDRKKISEGKISKGKAISKNIGDDFPDVDKGKLNVVQTLLESSSQLLDDGNYFAHTLFLENFSKDMEAYKAKKKLDEINSPEIFCFLTNLGLSGSSFDESFSFLSKFFNKNLRLKKNVDILNEYFN